MIQQFPAFIAACCVTLYWVTVVVKLIKLSSKIGKTPNIIPRERLGRKLRLLWGPVILFWIIQTWLGAINPTLTANLSPIIPYTGAIIALLATALTFICWHKMGTSWRIGIDPKEKTQLIFTGPYQFVRHPIYSLSILLAIGTWLTVPTLLLLITVILHISLLVFEALREEQYLIKQHGQIYINYIKMVGRFIPKRFSKMTC